MASQRFESLFPDFSRFFRQLDSGHAVRDRATRDLSTVVERMGQMPDLRAAVERMGQIPDLRAAVECMGQIPDLRAAVERMTRMPDLSAAIEHMRRMPDLSAALESWPKRRLQIIRGSTQKLSHDFWNGSKKKTKRILSGIRFSAVAVRPGSLQESKVPSLCLSALL
jgi:predicted TIM-barrel fold metal-dependent hydrolase